MIISDLAIRRPVVCIVLMLIVVIVGLLSFGRLPVREYPDIDRPVVSLDTRYPGAAPEVVETQITDLLEERLSAIDGLRVIRSESREARSRITMEFDLRKNIDEAANDVRDRITRGRDRLPQEVDPPEVSKADSDDDPVLTLSFNSDRFTRLELAEFATRIAAQRLQTVPGVAAVALRGPRFAMRMWLDPERLAAYDLTVADVERALRQQNVDIPGGNIESVAREFTVRLQGRLEEVPDFENLVLATRGDYQVKFSDVGAVELGASDYRIQAYFNGDSSISLQVQRQSQSNLLEVAAAIKRLLPEIRANMPDGINVEIAYDTSVFVERSVREVYFTLFIAGVLVILTIFVFLRDWRATVIPLIAIPVSLIGSMAVIHWLGFSINLLTLLAMVLAVGLVVDDAIIMLENIYRRIENGEGPIHAAIFGARQMTFAIISTTLTLAAVFLPVAFQSGSTGRLFFEFGLTLSVCVICSSLVALSLTPMLCSRILSARRSEGRIRHGWFYRFTEPAFARLNGGFAAALGFAFRHRVLILAGCLAFALLGPWFYSRLQTELTPAEDRGIFRVNLQFPLGVSAEYAAAYAEDVEVMIRRIPEVVRVFRLTGMTGSTQRGYMFVTLADWEERTRSTQEILSELRREFQTFTGGLASATPIRPLGGRRSTAGGIQMVLQGPEFDVLQETGGRFIEAMRESGAFLQMRLRPEPNKPQLDVRLDRARAADLRVPVVDVANTLQTMFGGRRVTEFKRGSDQYDVLLQVRDSDRTSPSDLARVYVRSTDGHLIQLSNLVDWREEVVPESYPHYNRQRSLELSAQLADGLTQGDGVAMLSVFAEEFLPEGYGYSWEGETREFVDSAADTIMLFGLALLFTFLILAAQFESWVHPITIFTGVALALAGGVMVLYLSRFWGEAMTDNIFSRFGLIMLIGLVAKNGILIVEFANQLQVEGRDARTAAFEAATLRFRPILMTAISTILGALPIALATGPGAESRNPLGLVVVGGLGIATFLTLFVIPIVYHLMDTLYRRVFGHSSASGLVRARDIQREAEEAARGVKV